jgi:hypothetical protein
VCGAAGAVRGGAGVGVGVCPVAKVAAANKNKTQMALLIIRISLKQVSEAARVYLARPLSDNEALPDLKNGGG